MDDLAGLDWNTSSQQSSNRPPPLNSTANYYPGLKPTPPLSGRSTPLTTNFPKSPATPGNGPSTAKPDSFANLLPSFNTSQTTKNLSLKEQQTLLEEQKRAQSISQARQWDSLGTGSSSTSASVSRTASPAPFSVQALNGQSNGQRLPTRSSTPLDSSQSKIQSTRTQSEDVNDILAAFNSAAPVDRSSHFPVPSRPDSRNIPPQPATKVATSMDPFDDNDDPFGLGTNSSSSHAQAVPAVSLTEDEDVLGLLGKPVSELPPPRSPSPIRKSVAHPADAAVAELVDMGFPAGKAREALATTESGLDVQAAVGYLLQHAHSESRSKSRPTESTSGNRRQRDLSETSGERSDVLEQKTGPRTRDDENRSAQSKDAARIASEIGNNFFKTANSLWKAGQKKVNKAMAELNAEQDTTQPKWMRNASAGAPPTSTNGSRAAREEQQQAAMTDEAALLEMGGGRPPSNPNKNPKAPLVRPLVEDASRFSERRSASDGIETRPEPSRSRLPEHAQEKRPAAHTRLTRESNEEAEAYISPARRRKTTPKPAQTQPESSLLVGDDEFTSSAVRSRTVQPNPQSMHTSRVASARPKSPVVLKAQVPPRKMPTLPAAVLQSSTKNRLNGTAAFKLGNYGEAHESYTAALRDVPTQHPLTIVLLTNRALTSLKTGDPKQCIVDADQAIEIIGPSKGSGESITIGGDEGIKDMAPYWGKAMMRRAEAMEQLERWIDAAKVWKECVEAGVGGGQSVQGRARCEKASGTGQASQPASRKPTPVPKKPAAKPVQRSALDDLTGKPVVNSSGSSEAVTRLRAANEAAAKLDDERFALTDAVASRVETWKKGKEQNLRALLGSLDTVLWADSGWKKVGMAELLNPSKVKINYMKGIAKVHPDKLPTTATTEQVMISGAVFSTLNEAWDGFKKENGL